MSKIYINPGHGGSDSGAVGIGGRQEKVDALKYASKVADLLKSAGHTVKLERDGDYLINVKDIAAKANAWGADYFIAFHRNSGGGTGAECLVVSNASQKSRDMAQAIQNALVTVGFKNRGVKKQDKNTYVLSHTTMPATTIECGFMDSQVDNDLFDSKFDAICSGIANAIISIVGGGSVTPTPEPTPTPTPSEKYTLNRILKLESPMMKGDDVKHAQELLEKHLAQPGKIDGVFGENTKAAVIRFQKARIADGYDLGSTGADGKIGQKTWEILGGVWTGSSSSSSSSSSSPKPSTSIPKLTRTLKYTFPLMKGDDVRQAQERLEKHLANPGSIDGKYGKNTEQAVKRFQQARINEGRDVGCSYNGNKPDGKIGEKTWAILWE